MTSPDKAQVEELAKAIEGGTAQDFFWKHTSAGLVSEAEVILKVKGALARAKNSTAATLASARSLRLMLAIVIVVGLGTLVSRVLGAENVAKGLSLLSILIAAGSSVSIKKFLE